MASGASASARMGRVFSAFKSRLGALSAETSASGAYCTAFGRATGILVDYQGGVLGALGGAGAGALAGGFVGGEPGAIVGGVLGGAAGGVVGALLTDYVGRALDVDGLATQACNAVVAAVTGDDPDTSTTDVEMPNPVTDETGLTPTDIQIAIGLARLETRPSAWRATRSTSSLVGSRLSFHRSRHARLSSSILCPTQRWSPSSGRSLSGPWLGSAGRAAARVCCARRAPQCTSALRRKGVSLRFRRVRTGEYVAESGHRPR